MLPSNKTLITYCPDVKLGRIKAMHGVGQPPVVGVNYPKVYH